MYVSLDSDDFDPPNKHGKTPNNFLTPAWTTHHHSAVFFPAVSSAVYVYTETNKKESK